MLDEFYIKMIGHWKALIYYLRYRNMKNDVIPLCVFDERKVMI